MLSGSYGNSLRLSIQRLLGSLMGVVIVVIFSEAWSCHSPWGSAWPWPACLLGGALGLQVGYKVAGNIVIMGWLVHSAEETTWGFTRLFWTAIGILISLWATRYVWPSAAIPSLHRQFAAFIDEIIQEFNLEVDRLEADMPTRLSMQQRRERRSQLLTKINAVRVLQATAQVELGVNPEMHPLHRLWAELELFDLPADVGAGWPARPAGSDPIAARNQDAPPGGSAGAQATDPAAVALGRAAATARSRRTPIA